MTKGKRRNQQEWQSIFQQQKDSGLTVQVYCEQYNLCSKTFYAHRRKMLVCNNKVIKRYILRVVLINLRQTNHY